MFIFSVVHQITCTKTKKRFFQRFHTFFPNAHRYLWKKKQQTYYFTKRWNKSNPQLLM